MNLLEQKTSLEKQIKIEEDFITSLRHYREFSYLILLQEQRKQNNDEKIKKEELKLFQIDEMRNECDKHLMGLYAKKIELHKENRY